MFDWLRRLIRSSVEDERQRFFNAIDARNAAAGGGKPAAITRSLGRLKLRSGTLSLSDPQYISGLEVPNIGADEVEISASLWQYPSGKETVSALRLGLGEPPSAGTCRKVGEIAIDSARLVLADKADLDEHWTNTGVDRIGVISTARDDTVLRLLSKRFKLKTVRVGPLRAEVVGPVSVDLEAEIEAFLKQDPQYADYPFMHFRVQTNNSFERANYLSDDWGFIPIGNRPTPLMFVCRTGRGDGCYDVEALFAGETPRVLTISFIQN